MPRWPAATPRPDPLIPPSDFHPIPNVSDTSSLPIPVRFGAPQRQLFGLLHLPAAVASGRGVVLCQAFGQEAVRAHRMLRVLAERLSRQGHAVLRFDHFGAGDADGDDADVELQGWSNDVLQADAELRQRSGVGDTVWMGMRLGATAALLAARQAPATLRRLVLWDGIWDGRGYLEALRARHIDNIEEAFSLMPSPPPRTLARDPSALCDEALGYAISPALRAQLAAWPGAQGLWPAAPADIVAIVREDAHGADLRAALTAGPQRVRLRTVHHDIDWTHDTADNTALVPTQALLALAQEVGAP